MTADFIGTTIAKFFLAIASFFSYEGKIKRTKNEPILVHHRFHPLEYHYIWGLWNKLVN